MGGVAVGEAVDSQLALPQNRNPASRREGLRSGLPIRSGSSGGNGGGSNGFQKHKVAGEEAVGEFLPRLALRIHNPERKVKGFSWGETAWIPSKSLGYHQNNVFWSIPPLEIPSACAPDSQSGEEAVGEFPPRLALWLPYAGGNGI